VDRRNIVPRIKPASEKSEQQKENKITPPQWLEGLNRAILETALDCIITIDAGGRVREFNHAAEQVFGYKRSEAVGEELATLIIPPALRQRHREGLAHYLKTGEGPVLNRRIEISAMRKDGSEILVELAITPFEIEGSPFFTAYLRDITERVQNERRRAAQYTIANLLAGSGSLEEVGPEIIQTIAASGNWVFGALWRHDEADETLRCAATWHLPWGKLESFDKVTREIVFKKSIGLPGRVLASEEAAWVFDVTVDLNFPRAQAAVDAGLRGGFGFPLCAESKVAGVIELFSPVVVQPDDDLMKMVQALGSQIGLFIHRRKIENELQQQKENAEAANAAKDQFLASLSHELRTPLNPVLLWAGGTLKQPDLAPELAEGLQMVCRNIELEARLIDDLLDLTRITRGKLQLHLRTCDAHELLRHAMEIIRSEAAVRRLNLQVHLDATHHHVFVDAPRVQQVFWNVLRNAYKFTPDRGIVTVRTSNPASGELVIEISDNGVGIEPKFLEKIFDAFEQVGSRREGLGLGLAISKAIIEMHDGTIRAESSGLGQGATFIISLKLAAPSEKNAGNTPPLTST
jgi:two-component system, cell cycle sensor histidine kinase and response regulator CckA